MKIGIDIDGVLCDHVPSVCRWASEKYGIDARPEMVTEWDVQIKGHSFGDLIFETYSDSDFVMALPPYPGAVNGVRQLKRVREVELVIVTSRRYAQPTIWWVEEHFGRMPVYLAEDKTTVGLDGLIDDHGPTIFGICKKGGTGI